MTNTTRTEEATGNPTKKRKTNPNGATNETAMTTTQAAATTTSARTIPSTVTGTRLEPVAHILALQPNELKGTLISKLTEMLDLRATIKQRESTMKSQYEKPSTTPATGADTADVPDTPPFIPSSLRGKNPVEATKQKNDHPKMKELLAESLIIYTDWQHKAAKIVEKMAKLEITLRQEDLRNLLFVIVDKMSLAHTIISKIMSDGFDPSMKLKEDQIIAKTSHDVLLKLPVETAVAFGVEDGLALSKKYATSRSYDDDTTSSQMDDGVFKYDHAFIEATVGEILPWIPELTVGLWRREDAKEKKRAVSAALKEALEKQEMLSATQDVEDAMETEDANNPPQGLIETIRKETNRAVGKEMQRVKQSMRKNSLGGDKTKPPKPTTNGRESNQGSKTSRKTSKKASQAGGDKSKQDKSKNRKLAPKKTAKRVSFDKTAKSKGQSSKDDSAAPTS